MSQLRKHITTFLAVVSVLGMLMSVFHSHSESLKCLAHPDEVHFSQDVDVCTICIILVRSNFNPTTFDSLYLVVVDTIVSVKPLKFAEYYTHQSLGRSPPFMA